MKCDISPLGNITSISYLDLSNNNISDISVLLDMSVREVDLRGNPLVFSEGSAARNTIDEFVRSSPVKKVNWK